MKEFDHLSFQKILQAGQPPDADTAARVAQHLEICSECREFAAFHAYLEQALPDLAAAPPPYTYPQQTAAILNRFRSRQMIASTLQTTHKLGLAAALVIVLVLGLSWAVKTLIPAPIPAAISTTSPGPAETAAPENTLQPSASPPTQATPEPTAAPRLDEPVLLAQLNRGEIERFKLSPDRKWIAIGSSSQVCLVAASDYREQWCVPVGPTWQSSPINLVFRPDSAQIAVWPARESVLLLDTHSGEIVRSFSAGSSYPIRSLAWSPDGSRLATGSDSRNVSVLDAQTGKSLQTLRADDSAIAGLAWSPNGSRLAAVTYFGSIWAWETEQFEAVLTPDPDKDYSISFSSITWAPEGDRLYTTGYLPYGCGEGCQPAYVGWVQAWDAASGEKVYEITVEDPLATLAVSPDGRWLAAGGEVYGTLIVASAQSGEQVAMRRDAQPWRGLDWLNPEQILLISDQRDAAGKTLGVWNPTNDMLQEHTLPGYDSFGYFGWLPEENRLVTRSRGGGMALWQGRTGESVEELPDLFNAVPQGQLAPDALSPNGIHLAVILNQMVQIYRIDTGQRVSTEGAFTIPGTAQLGMLKWSNDGTKLAVQVSDTWDEAAWGFHNHSIWVWDAFTEERLATIAIDEKPSHLLAYIAWSPDDIQIAVGWSTNERARVEIWELQTQTQVSALSQSVIRGILWPHPDQLFVLADWVEILDPHTLHTMSRVHRGATSFDINLNNQLVAVGNGETVLLYNLSNPHEFLASLSGTIGSIRQLRFNPDGSLIATLTEGGVISIWDISVLIRALPVP